MDLKKKLFKKVMKTLRVLRS